MRTETEMLELITKVAAEDDRIRAVLLTGSRANPEAPADKYQDYDITYFVKDVTPFYNNMSWIADRFGVPAICQLPELMTHPLLPPVNDGHFIYLMIFSDGVRLDLSIECTPYIDDGEPALTLLDKDGFLPPLPPPSGSHWHIRPPDAKLYADCCNEFWWCLNNVAKGIARDELPYAMEMLQHYVGDMLRQMTEWYIGVQNDFTVSAGKMGKYYKKYLPPSLYEMYTAIYSPCTPEDIWKAVFTISALFRRLALCVAAHFGYIYNQQEDTFMRSYLVSVQEEGILSPREN